MGNLIGEAIYQYRKLMKLTQEEFGKKFDVSGPAIFKFEKGVVHPSLDLWIRIARDMEIPEKKAVLMWIKDRLPAEYQYLVNVEQEVIVAETGKVAVPQGRIDYSTIEDRKKLRRKVLKDNTLPRSLRSFLRDEEVWVIYKPTGEEINFLRDVFGKFPRANKALFREALRLYRQFTGKE
ncbi:MAG: helix-turn-helix domain-containing protein [Candidatus Sumerlaeia bacterium]|nr:helix-turn-helix domain-containing protein [Candidatus Sumerlaeia bacterium]